jgi:protein TonB
MLLVATFVLWTFCLAVGIVGFTIPAMQQTPPATQPPIDAVLENVEATSAHPALVSGSHSTPTPASAAPTPPDPPQIVAPGTPVAFAVPVNAPVHNVQPRGVPSPRPATQNPVIQLTYGVGEGDQPLPEYPDEARFAGQEGTVVIQFTVNESGRVVDAQIASPCQWPILNSAALRAIHDTWRFVHGPVRRYEVSIEFHLNKQQ